MGQTLTHGVYLPDEGERNCYNGLAANWQILDSSVGTIAAHTAALAGKAPLVHTHGNITNDGKVGTAANKPLITGTDGVVQAGSFGNAANTFCEGNDSRLSDARTPVAHTHTKSDVTDLFNSANVWSNANTFTRNADDSFLLFKSTKIDALVPTDTNYHFADLNFYDVNSKIISKIRSSGAGTKIVTEITARSWSADGTTNEEVKLDLVSDIQNSDKKTTINSNFIPSANNSYDLGASSYQWNNLYAKNYYYNGTAWGLDKANTWTQSNEYKYLIGLSGAEIWFKQPNIEDITANPDANISKSIIKIYNKTATQYSGEIADNLRTDGSHRLVISCFGFPLNNYAGYYPHTFYFEAKRDGTASFSPSYTNASLGTSSAKWKTLNGSNPGALSLPVTALNNTYDISGNITDLTGGNNAITAARTGWIFVKSDNATEISIANTTTGMGASDHSASATTLMVSIPVTSGETLNIIANCTSIDKAYLLPCQGNV